MGFPSVCYTVLLPRPLALVVHLLDRLKLALSTALFYLGLSSSSSSYGDDDDGGYFFAYSTLHSLPDLQPASSSSPAAAAVKTRLPVVQFSTLLASGEAAAPATTTASACAVCLGALEAAHEVRALGNCSHAFHRGCIDRWMDIGHLTCPLCRALLLPMEMEEEEEEEHEVNAAALT